jgi:hypothetical protein
MSAPRLCLAAVMVLLAAPEVWAGRGPTTTRGAAPPLPQTPGHHNLFFNTRLNKDPLKLAYGLFLPATYAARGPRKPMVVFLVGAGECGNNHQALYVHGPAAELQRNKDLAAWADFIVLSPQCPGGMRWEQPGLPAVVVEVIEYAKKGWRVDADRVYLTGLSMGGTGTWVIALAAPRNTFAAIAPISANAFEPEKLAQHLKGTTAWVIVADNDGGYTEGSRKMVKTLAAQGVDALLTEVPGLGHGAWGPYYAGRRFYEFLCLHRRGQPPPQDRPFPEQLRAIALQPPNSMDAKLEGPLRALFPYWHLLNCGSDLDPGPKVELNGRKNVFVTCPLNRQTPCMLMKTVTVPSGARSVLHLIVGHHPEGEWELVVRGDGEELFKTLVGKEQSTNGWLDLRVDLTAYVGREVRLELLNQSTGRPRPAAYWGAIDVETAK